MVTVYHTHGCFKCKNVMRWLDDNDVKYDDVNLTDHPEKIDFVKHVLGYSTMPVVTVDDDVLFAGSFDVAKLMSLK